MMYISTARIKITERIKENILIETIMILIYQSVYYLRKVKQYREEEREYSNLSYNRLNS